MTLPETLVVIGLMGILMYVSGRVITSGYEFYHSTSTSVTLQRYALLTLTRISQDLAISHRASLNVENPGTPDSSLVIPYPQDIDEGCTKVDKTGELLWQSIVAYRLGPGNLVRPLPLDAASPLPNPILKNYYTLFRYFDDVKNGTGYANYDTAAGDNDYVTNIEYVDPKTTALDVINNTIVPARRQVVSRNVVEFRVDERIDTVDIEITVVLPGRVQGGNRLDTSLTLQTTAFPKN